MRTTTHRILLSAALSVCAPLLVGCDDDPDGTATSTADAGPDPLADTSTATADTAGDEADGDSEGASLGEPCLNPGTPGATATCLEPSFPPDYYVAEALAYFDTLDVDADPESVPLYSDNVARWEWPPWLLLTGLGKDDMIESGLALKAVDPSTVPVRDCRFFPVQPFARCTITFIYDKGPCPIYEEFTFNEAGETTFIEAWSDLPGLRPQTDDGDFWGEEGSFYRLATRVPGLGTPSGAFDLDSEYMADAAAADEHVADFAMRAADWQSFWFDALIEADEDFFAQGCGW